MILLSNTTECENSLKIFKNLIFEIFGNIYYDYSKPEFIEHNKKIIIYMKIRKVPEEIKQFRKEQ